MAVVAGGHDGSRRGVSRLWNPPPTSKPRRLSKEVGRAGGWHARSDANHRYWSTSAAADPNVGKWRAIDDANRSEDLRASATACAGTSQPDPARACSPEATHRRWGGLRRGSHTQLS